MCPSEVYGVEDSVRKQSWQVVGGKRLTLLEPGEAAQTCNPALEAKGGDRQCQPAWAT